MKQVLTHLVTSDLFDLHKDSEFFEEVFDLGLFNSIYQVFFFFFKVVILIFLFFFCMVVT